MIAIIAPAGYGKTTLLSDWAERDRRRFAWVSVDEADVDPVVFLSHVAVALDRLEELDAERVPGDRFPGAANPGGAVRRLGAAISKRARPFVLVLDELDRADEPLCLDAVASLAPYLPEGSSIAIAARTVPNVGFARFRAGGRLLEIGVDDLALDAVAARRLLRGAGFLATKTEARGAHRRDRGLAGRPLPGGAVPPAAATIRGTADPFLRRGPVHRRLCPLGGLEAPLEGAATLPDEDLDPGATERPALRRAPPTFGIRTNPGVDRAREPPRRPARPRAAVVSLPIAVP